MVTQMLPGSSQRPHEAFEERPSSEPPHLPRLGREHLSLLFPPALDSCFAVSRVLCDAVEPTTKPIDTPQPSPTPALSQDQSPRYFHAGALGVARWHWQGCVQSPD